MGQLVVTDFYVFMAFNLSKYEGFFVCIKAYKYAYGVFFVDVVVAILSKFHASILLADLV